MLICKLAIIKLFGQMGRKKPLDNQISDGTDVLKSSKKKTASDLCSKDTILENNWKSPIKWH